MRQSGKIVFFLLSATNIFASDPSSTIACQMQEKCALLMGQSDGSATAPLRDLAVDILKISQSQQWIQKKVKPPLDVSLRLASSLRSCYAKASKLNDYSLHQCLGKKASAPDKIKIIDRLLPNLPARIKLLAGYLERHTGNSSVKLEKPTTVVTHWTATAPKSVEQVILAFAQVKLLSHVNPKDSGGTLANVSCHFVVDRDGTIYQLLPENLIARHAVGLNRSSICIENVGGPRFPLTPEQVTANALLINDLVLRNPTINNMIGHAESADFEESRYFEEKTTYRSARVAEPGRNFLRDLRKALDAIGNARQKAGVCDT